MKTILKILLLLSFAIQVKAQFSIDSTRFIGGSGGGGCCAGINYTIPTLDKGILFVGYSRHNPGGDIPTFLIDTIGENVLVGKIDSNRQLSWVKVFGGTQNEYASSACQTQDGGYAVLAYTESNDGDVTGFKGGSDIWLLRLDATGNLLWGKCYGSSVGDIAISITNTADSGYVILGITDGSDDDVPFHYGSYSTMDWLVIKTDDTGKVQWSKDIGGTLDEGEQYMGSVLSANNGYYLVSSTNSTDHDCIDTFWHPGVNTSGDFHILRLDTSGNVLWDSSYGGSRDDEVYNAIWDDRDSSIVVTGCAYSYDYMVTDYHGEGDMLTLKVNKNGTLKWIHSLGWHSWDVGTSVIKGTNKGYIVYGSTFPDPDTTMGDIGQQDLWIIYVDSLGNGISKQIFGGIGEEASASVVPIKNGYAITGVSGSSVFTEGSSNPNYSGAFVSFIDFTPLGINESEKENNQIKLYPNPANNSVKIVLPVNENSEITILNSLGQIEFDEKYEKTNRILEINISNFLTGIYLVEWQNSNGLVFIDKFIKY